ncbi:MAG: DNA mismatch repair endonuclease MutL [Kofleriaceae bacterium]|nr:DNA mismatch repair endonuclease MutL [Kofleriaceae bacterium]MBP9169147.1 DNA mismatch repair endonuclease MutL [Kofleriaceae bacterium]MBP9857840.1 DNA mismatch repair endonuclease MutL [Kofleriaceae bacterium]
MGRVAVLADPVIDQIAAGEVVERPASVVKELVENALDAEATQIAIDVEGGGRRSIRVVDDGIGMEPDDARLALTRHATSKLRAVDDLTTIATMGFRGEALPSIASVSRLVLTTRPRGVDAAVAVTVDNGAIVATGAAGAPPGTQVVVRDLLANVPARLKFLRGEATEAAHVTEAVMRLALAHPAVGFRLSHNGRPALEVPAQSAAARVRALLGARVAGRLHAIEHRESGVVVRAWIAAPELAQTTSRGVHLFAGRRWVRDRGLLQAVTMGYGELMPRGRYPVAVVFVDVPGAEIDVNVHPQKLEVRFSDPALVTAAVRHAVRGAVAGAPWLGETAGRAPVAMQAVASAAPPSWTAPRPNRADDLAGRYAAATTRALFPTGGLGRAPTHQGALALDAGGPRWDGGRAAAPPPASGPSSGTSSEPSSAPRSGPRPTAPDEPVEATAPDDDAPAPSDGYFARLRYLGQLDRTYLLCEGDGELVLIDQHAAHERVAFQRLRDRADRDEVAVQRLLFPTVVELPPAEAALVVDHAEVLARVGFEVAPFGGHAVAVAAVPAGLRHEPTAVLRELCGELAERGGSRALAERLDHVLATVACHSVVRAGDALAPDEVVALLGQMDGVDFRAHCPHGRPVLLRIGTGEIARRFGR